MPSLLFLLRSPDAESTPARCSAHEAAVLSVPTGTRGTPAVDPGVHRRAAPVRCSFTRCPPSASSAPREAVAASPQHDNDTGTTRGTPYLFRGARAQVCGIDPRADHGHEENHGDGSVKGKGWHECVEGERRRRGAVRNRRRRRGWGEHRMGAWEPGMGDVRPCYATVRVSRARARRRCTWLLQALRLPHVLLQVGCLEKFFPRSRNCFVEIPI